MIHFPQIQLQSKIMKKYNLYIIPLGIILFHHYQEAFINHLLFRKHCVLKKKYELF